jgi:co-chaperonin GroES (HSP10)
MQPLGDHLLIKPDEAKKKTDAGIYLSEQWETRPPTGVIMAVGPNVTQKELKVGTKVVFMRYGATQTNDKDLKLVKEGHILATMQ